MKALNDLVLVLRNAPANPSASIMIPSSDSGSRISISYSTTTKIPIKTKQKEPWKSEQGAFALNGCTMYRRQKVFAPLKMMTPSASPCLQAKPLYRNSISSEKHDIICREGTIGANCSRECQSCYDDASSCQLELLNIIIAERNNCLMLAFCGTWPLLFSHCVAMGQRSSRLA